MQIENNNLALREIVNIGIVSVISKSKNTVHGMLWRHSYIQTWNTQPKTLPVKM